METALATEDWAEQAAPIAPTPSGKRRECGERIVRTLRQAESALETAMAYAYRTGDISVGYISGAGTRTKWRYEVTCVTYDPQGVPCSELLARADVNAPIELVVNNEYVTSASLSGVAYRRRGTWRIRLEHVAPDA